MLYSTLINPYCTYWPLWDTLEAQKRNLKYQSSLFSPYFWPIIKSLSILYLLTKYREFVINGVISHHSFLDQLVHFGRQFLDLEKMTRRIIFIIQFFFTLANKPYVQRSNPFRLLFTPKRDWIKIIHSPWLIVLLF